MANGRPMPSLRFTEAAAERVKALVSERVETLIAERLRVLITEVKSLALKSRTSTADDCCSGPQYDFIAEKVQALITEVASLALRLRIYITGGGCSGFQYAFKLDDQVQTEDIIIDNQGAMLVVDPMSVQYLNGAAVDYLDGLEGSRFVVNNPSAKTTCGCGSSFTL